jgi:hypothetical protein
MFSSIHHSTHNILRNTSKMAAIVAQLSRGVNLPLTRSITTAPRDRSRKEGDISSVFASLSGAGAAPLPERFSAIKTALIRGNESAIAASWSRLLPNLRTEIEHIDSVGPDVIPSIHFSDIHNHSRVQAFEAGLKKRGAGIVRGVVPEDVALGWKDEIQQYIRKNPQTKGFPVEKPAVYELYWSPGQIKARAHPNMLETQKFLMSFWHSDDADAPISTNHALAYADRVRIRQPGDAGFALGAHVDGGSAELWETEGYGGRDGTYREIFAGNWEAYDPWESSSRLEIESDMYNGAGACSMFRMFQGWLAMSNTGPGEGTLLVNPLFKLATAYFLLRPFFSPKNTDVNARGYLDEANWQLDPVQSSTLEGVSLGCTQELNAVLHPHLDLARTMTHILAVWPGDYVAWHCDAIHAVDKVHAGKSDSSVLYIPACPLTEVNVQYMIRQRAAFLEGRPGPDFPGGKGESEFVERMGMEDIEHAGGVEALRAAGLKPWDNKGKRIAFVKEMNDLLSKGQ